MSVKLGKLLDGERGLSTASSSEQKEVVTQLVRQISFMSQVQRRSDAIKSERFVLLSAPVEGRQSAGKFKVEVLRKRGYHDAVAQVIVGDDSSLSHVELKRALEMSVQSGQPHVVD